MVVSQRFAQHRSSSKISAATLAASALLTASLAASALLVPVAGAASARATGKTRTIMCRGGSSSCKAVVSVAGGASREKLKIELSDTDLKLRGVVARPSSIKGAYQLYGARYSLGGSLYTVMLNAVQSIPRGSTLTFTFAVPRR